MNRFLLMVAVVALALPASATAHNSHGWFWGARLAEQRLIYSTDYTIYRARCFGFGQWIWSDDYTTKLYRHFDYFIRDSDGKAEIILHVKGKRAFSIYYA